MSGILSGVANPTRYWKNSGPSGVSPSISCSSGVMPEVTKSRSRPASSTVEMPP